MRCREYPSQVVLLAAFEDIGDTIRWRIRPSHAVLPGTEVRGMNSYGYYRVKLSGTEYLVHRVLWVMRNGTIDPVLQVDHIDGNRLNNFPENLRMATHSENRRNMMNCSLNTSGVKGVSWNTAMGRWKVTIRAGGRNRHFGYFIDLDDAEGIAREARERLHGEFTNHGAQVGCA